MSDNNILDFGDAAIIIKDAIIRSRFQAAKLVNKELLGLYYAVGKYVSDNSRASTWGKGAISQLSDDLQRELPGLRGFSEVSIKRMRLFYEAWQAVFTNRPLITDDLSNAAERPLPMDVLENGIDLGLLMRHISGYPEHEFLADNFYKVGFTHHSEILAKEKSLNGRMFYISHCSTSFWTVDILKSHLRGDLYTKAGTIPSNFIKTMPESEQAHRAIRAFKDDYFLDYINIEDEVDPDERVIERSVITNIKKFVLSFGNCFSFIGDQYRVMVHEQEYFIDLLFFNRELRCLVAVELKRGDFRPAHLGQLQFYLSALDEYVRLPDESPSIGILLCKEANRGIVEFAVRDYTKPMGVATYRTRNEMPETWRKALPDADDMKKLLDAAPDEISEVGE
jgi:predicted nuclease of restriction endonuclease-like (RecB) superfamily